MLGEIKPRFRPYFFVPPKYQITNLTLLPLQKAQNFTVRFFAIYHSYVVMYVVVQAGNWVSGDIKSHFRLYLFIQFLCLLNILYLCIRILVTPYWGTRLIFFADYVANIDNLWITYPSFPFLDEVKTKFLCFILNKLKKHE